jgi:hypothetical protein
MPEASHAQNSAPDNWITYTADVLHAEYNTQEIGYGVHLHFKRVFTSPLIFNLIY